VVANYKRTFVVTHFSCKIRFAMGGWYCL
jgi:hypothetical protein